MFSMQERAKLNISTSLFAVADNRIPCVGEFLCAPPQEQYILRTLVKTPNTDFRIPPELSWLIPALVRCADYQQEHFPVHPYVYITSRCGKIKSVTDDEWHVDGFSVKIPHIPEQNYFWSNVYPTEVLNQQFDIPPNFDGLKHNIAWYFQDHAEENKSQTISANKIHVIDPYIVHRRPKLLNDTERAFFRITFVPIPIRTDTDSTPNPLLHYPKYRSSDIRSVLLRYVD